MRLHTRTQFSFLGAFAVLFAVTLATSLPAFAAPDLTGTITKIKHKVKPLGDKLVVKLTVSNTGEDIASGPFTVSLYLSDDLSLDKDDRLLDSFEINRIKPGRSKGTTKGKRKFKLPWEDSFNSEFFIISIDDTSIIDESSEENNLLVGQIGDNPSTRAETDIEPNDDFSTAEPIAIGGSFQGTIDSADDEDVYQFHITDLTSGPVFITLTPPPGTDYDLELYDANEEELTKAEPAEDSANTVVLDTPQIGTYFIKVVGFKGATDPGEPYTISWPSGFLQFPLKNKSPSTAPVTAVFDHAMPAYYKENGTIVAFNAEEGMDKLGCDTNGCVGNTSGYKRDDGQAFFQNRVIDYVGVGRVASSPTFLQYDGHPAFDFRTTEQDREGNVVSFITDGETPVLAAADGRLLRTGTDCAGNLNENDWGILMIKHGNDYATCYLHLSERELVPDRTVVKQGQQIGISGDTAPPGVDIGPHLHFEVRKLVNGDWQSVDPYGWQPEFFVLDPYTQAKNITLWEEEPPPVTDGPISCETECPPASLDPAITVTVPAGGEVWEVSTTQEIAWSFTGNPGEQVNINLLQNGIFAQVIEGNTPIGGQSGESFDWTIPASTLIGSTFSIQIISNKGIEGRSDGFFTIIASDGVPNANPDTNPDTDPTPPTTPATKTLTVNTAGTGSGTVTSSPAGIACGADCAESYTQGTVVTVAATADSGSTFAGWSGGDCSGIGTCQVTMTADVSVTATFSVQAATPVLPPPLLWKVASTLTIIRPPALGDDGRFYTTTRTLGAEASYGITAFDPTDGSIVWGPVIPPGCNTAFGLAGVSVGANGLVYGVGDWNECGNGRLVAFNSTDGSIAWDHGDCPGGGNTSPHPRQTPALDESLNSLYFGSSSLCSVDMDSGSNNWVAGGGRAGGEGGMAIDSQQNVYYGTTDFSTNFLRSYSSTGTFRWETTAGVRGSQIMGVLPGDQILVRLHAANALLALDNAGNTQWQFDDVNRAVADEAGNIYASTVSGADIVSLNPDGTERWRRTLPSATWAQVDFVDNSGHVYARGNNVLYALNTSDGSITWSFSADADLGLGRGVALAPGGRIFLSDDNANLYLLNTSLDYAASSWPIAEHGNRRHTQKVGDILALP